MNKKITHVDEKILTPDDSNISQLSPEDIGKHYAKPIRGYVVISDSDGKILETPNLVLLPGREFLAQKLSDIQGSSNLPSSTVDLSKFKIRYFGVGIGGADTSTQPTKIGPYDNDTDLSIPGKFADDSLDTDSTLSYNERFQYIHNGRMKKILSDAGADIQIIEEDHNVLINGVEIVVPAYTTIKYTLIINQSELYKETTESGPFAFNEAALYAVHHEELTSGTETYSVPATDATLNEASRYTADYRCFARFTTLTKWLEVNDSLKIEWYILV